MSAACSTVRRRLWAYCCGTRDSTCSNPCRSGSAPGCPSSTGTARAWAFRSWEAGGSSRSSSPGTSPPYSDSGCWSGRPRPHARRGRTRRTHRHRPAGRSSARQLPPGLLQHQGAFRRARRGHVRLRRSRRLPGGHRPAGRSRLDQPHQPGQGQSRAQPHDRQASAEMATTQRQSAPGPATDRPPPGEGRHRRRPVPQSLPRLPGRVRPADRQQPPAHWPKPVHRGRHPLDAGVRTHLNSRRIRRREQLMQAGSLLHELSRIEGDAMRALSLL